MDIKSPEERSKNMAAIRSKNTRPEMYFRKLLFAHGYRYSLNSGKVYGHPDIYLRKYNTAIFINGCFWHRHSGCKFAYMPKSRQDFWEKKFETNRKRDCAVRLNLYNEKIKCLVIWECTVKSMKRDSKIEKEIINRTEDFLENNELFREL